jgi:hypothetical protein
MRLLEPVRGLAGKRMNGREVVMPHEIALQRVSRDLKYSIATSVISSCTSSTVATPAAWTRNRRSTDILAASCHAKANWQEVFEFDNVAGLSEIRKPSAFSNYLTRYEIAQQTGVSLITI